MNGKIVTLKDRCRVGLSSTGNEMPVRDVDTSVEGGRMTSDYLSGKVEKTEYLDNIKKTFKRGVKQ